MDQHLPEPISLYEIQLKGILPADWSSAFENMSFAYDSDGNTLLSGHVVDQAALHSLLDKVRDLGLTLLEVRRVSSADSGRT